jgi:hypothetical protein
MTSRKGFKWPTSGEVVCPYWSPEAECGNGLHGFLWGEGDGSLANWEGNAVWMVLEVEADKIVNLEGKVKFPAATVIYSGDRKTATDMIYARRHGAVIGATVTGGAEATVTGGDGATVTGGYGAKVMGGDYATVTGGNWAMVTGGDCATVTGGERAMVTGGNWATVTGGDEATVTGGDRATVTGGAGATVTGGNWATVTGGDWATIVLNYWDGERYRLKVGYIGENGLKPGVKYKLDDQHEFTEAK